MKWLKPDEVTEHGHYVMTRTDDPDIGYTLVELVTLNDVVVWCERERDRVSEASPIETWDQECRFLKLEHPKVIQCIS